ASVLAAAGQLTSFCQKFLMGLPAILQSTLSRGRKSSRKGSQTEPSQVSALSLPVVRSIQSKLTPGGGSCSRLRVGNCFIKSAQTCKAPPAPLSGVWLLSSRPSQTTARCSPLNPANQLSR